MNKSITLPHSLESYIYAVNGLIGLTPSLIKTLVVLIEINPDRITRADKREAAKKLGRTIRVMNVYMTNLRKQGAIISAGEGNFEYHDLYKDAAKVQHVSLDFQ